MTELLDKAFAEASRLPQSEQDQLATWILDELAGEAAWQQSFNASSDLLAELAAEAMREHRAGRTLPLDPETL